VVLETSDLILGILLKISKVEYTFEEVAKETIFLSWLEVVFLGQPDFDFSSNFPCFLY
jgi:hypothetical protein